MCDVRTCCLTLISLSFFSKSCSRAEIFPKTPCNCCSKACSLLSSSLRDFLIWSFSALSSCSSWSRAFLDATMSAISRCSFSFSCLSSSSSSFIRALCQSVVESVHYEHQDMWSLQLTSLKLLFKKQLLFFLFRDESITFLNAALGLILFCQSPLFLLFQLDSEFCFDFFNNPRSD